MVRSKGTRIDILLPKLFWPTVRKNWSSDREKLLKFEAEGREFAKLLRSLEQFIQTVKGQKNFLHQNSFLTCDCHKIMAEVINLTIIYFANGHSDRLL